MNIPIDPQRLIEHRYLNLDTLTLYDTFEELVESTKNWGSHYSMAIINKADPHQWMHTYSQKYFTEVGAVLKWYRHQHSSSQPSPRCVLLHSRQDQS